MAEADDEFDQEQRGRHPFGFGFPWDSYDTVSHGGGLSVMAAEYNYLTKNSTAEADSRSWLANISGANAWGVTFTVGDGDTFPGLHAASGGEYRGITVEWRAAGFEWGLWSRARILSGSNVGSARQHATIVSRRRRRHFIKSSTGNGAVYKDNVQSYSTDEPAIDLLTASSFLMYAWRISGGPRRKP